MTKGSSKLSGVALASALALGLMMTGGTAIAAPGDCAAEFTAVSEAIDAAEFFGRNADTNESNLRAKLAAAEAKVDLDKFSDAVDKLDDISQKVTDWAGAVKPKIDQDGADGINEAVAVAIDCVGGLGR